MTTRAGEAHVVYELASCTTIEMLRDKWHSIAPEYQRLPHVIRVKDIMKAHLSP